MKTAVSTGHSDQKPADVRRDDACDFGTWLRGPTGRALQTDPHYKAVARAHTDFHTSAAHVLELALAGKSTEATKELADNAKFVTQSAELVRVLMEWQRSVR